MSSDQLKRNFGAGIAIGNLTSGEAFWVLPTRDREITNMEGFLRPEATVLSEGALVPERNLIRPAPNQFTHAVTRSQPYYYGDLQPGTLPDGHFAAGTKVVLLVDDGGPSCRVANRQGLYVAIECAVLKRL